MVVIISTSFQRKKLHGTAIGDSITYLNDHTDETGNRITKGYMTLVTEKMPNIHYTNQGTTAGHRVALPTRSTNSALQTDVYSIFLGTNDWWAGRPLGTFRLKITGNNTVYGSFRIITNKLRSLNPAAKILLITPMKRVDFVYINGMKNNAWGSYKAKNGQIRNNSPMPSTPSATMNILMWSTFSQQRNGIQNLVNFKRLKTRKPVFTRTTLIRILSTFRLTPAQRISDPASCNPI